METKYDVLTNDKNRISYSSFILATLIELGLSPTSKGTYYLKDIIILAIQEYNNFNDIRLRDLINKVAIRKQASAKTIKSNIDYAFKYKNTFKSKEKFESIFNIKYDEYYITAKSITNLILNLFNK